MNEELIAKTKDASQKLTKHIIDTIDKMVREGIEINYVSVANEAKVSRQHLYRHPEIRKKIDAYRVTRMTKDELRKEVVRLRAKNK